MVFTLTSLITALLFSSGCILLLCGMFNRTNMVGRVGTKVIFLCIGLVFLKLFLPYEFKFTKSIYLSELFPHITQFFRAEIITILNYSIHVYHILLAVWVVGAVAYLARLVNYNLYLRKLLKSMQEVQSKELERVLGFINKKHNKNQKFRVVRIKNLTSPAITGIITPTILLPDRENDTPHLYYALLHEMTHFYNHDLWKKQVFAILSAVYWWNPCIKLLKNTFSRSVELNTDYSLTKDMSEEEVNEYLQCLIEASKNALEASGGVLSFGSKNPSALKQRFHFIIDSRRSKGSVLQKAATVLFAFGMLVLSNIIILEPIFKDGPNMEGTYVLSSENTYLIEKSNGYDIYVDEKFVATINEMAEVFKSYPVYQTESEAAE